MKSRLLHKALSQQSVDWANFCNLIDFSVDQPEFFCSTRAIAFATKAVTTNYLLECMRLCRTVLTATAYQTDQAQTTLGVKRQTAHEPNILGLILDKSTR